MQGEALARSHVTRPLRVLLVSRFLLTRGRDGHDGNTPGVGVALVGCPGSLVCVTVCLCCFVVPRLAALRCGSIKRTDVPNARYTASLQVGAASTVDEFIARWLAQARLDVDPGLVSLHLVHRGPARLTKDPAERKAAEEAATVLDPSDTLAQAGVADGSWLLAVFATPQPASDLAGESAAALLALAALQSVCRLVPF